MVGIDPALPDDPRNQGSAAERGSGEQEARDEREGRGDGRRERILQAALEVFARRGFHQAHLDEVARAAGVGKGTIYLYVPDKEGLLLEAIRHQLAVHEREVEQAVAQAPDAVARLYQVLYLDYVNLLSNVELARVLIAERAGLGFSSSFEDAMAAMRRQRRDLIASIMAEGIREGALRADAAPEQLAIAFTGMAFGILFDILFDDGPRLDPGEAAAFYLDLFLRGAASARA